MNLREYQSLILCGLLAIAACTHKSKAHSDSIQTPMSSGFKPWRDDVTAVEFDLKSGTSTCNPLVPCKSKCIEGRESMAYDRASHTLSYTTCPDKTIDPVVKTKFLKQESKDSVERLFAAIECSTWPTGLSLCPADGGNDAERVDFFGIRSDSVHESSSCYAKATCGDGKESNPKWPIGTLSDFSFKQKIKTIFDQALSAEQ